MNILVVSPFYAPYAGVGARRMTSLSEYLQTHGHQVTVVRDSPNCWNGQVVQAHINPSIEVLDVYYESGRLDAIRAYKHHLECLLSERTFDVAVFSCGPYYVMLLGPAFRRKYGQEYVIDQRDLWLFERKKYKLPILKRLKKLIAELLLLPVEGRAFSKSLGMVTVSRMDHEVLRRRYPLNRNRLYCIPNGYEHSHQVLTDRDVPDTPYVVYFGKFSYYGTAVVESVLSAIHRVNQQGYPLKLLHIGAPEDELNDAARNMSLPSGIVVSTGYLQYDVGMTYLSKAVAGILSSNFGNAPGTKVFDYISADKPIIACVSKSSAVAEVLAEAKHAYICQTSDQVANALLQILQHGISSLGMTNRERFSRSAANERYEKLLVQLVSKRGGRLRQLARVRRIFRMPPNSTNFEDTSARSPQPESHPPNSVC